MTMSNEYGLDYKHFQRKLEFFVRDAKKYTPDEMARELASLSKAADSYVILGESKLNASAESSRKSKVDKVSEIEHLKDKLERSELVTIANTNSRSTVLEQVAYWDQMLAKETAFADGIIAEIAKLENINGVNSNE
jgi:hypothetical protein